MRCKEIRRHAHEPQRVVGTIILEELLPMTLLCSLRTFPCVSKGKANRVSRHLLCPGYWIAGGETLSMAAVLGHTFEHRMLVGALEQVEESALLTESLRVTGLMSWIELFGMVINEKLK